MDAALMLAEMSGHTKSDEQKTIIYAYAFGALDCLAQQNQIDKRDTLVSVVNFFVQYFGMSPEEAAETSWHCLEMISDPKSERYVQGGGDRQ